MRLEMYEIPDLHGYESAVFRGDDGSFRIGLHDTGFGMRSRILYETDIAEFSKDLADWDNKGTSAWRDMLCPLPVSWHLVRGMICASELARELER